MSTSEEIKPKIEYRDPYALLPQELIVIPQWVAYKRVPSKKHPGKTDKIPIDPKTGEYASSTDPNTWGTLAEAVVACSRWPWKCHGVGFVLTNADLYVGIDLDNCIDENGVIAPRQQAIIARLNSYTEKSPSCKGIRIFCRGSLPAGGNKKDGLEMYATRRFLTVTGNHLPGTPLTIEERSAELAALHAEWFGQSEESAQPTTKVTVPVVVSPAGDCPPLTARDRWLLAKIRSRKGGARVIALLKGDISGYPSQSEAELAACTDLIFWNDYDPEPVDRIIRNSALYRSKWDEKHGEQTYGQMTIAKAQMDRRGWVRKQSTYSGQRSGLREY